MIVGRALRGIRNTASTSYGAAVSSSAAEGLGVLDFGAPLQKREAHGARRVRDDGILRPDDPIKAFELQLFREHNSSLMPLKGLKIFAKVVRVDKRYIYVDPGFKKLVQFPRKQAQIWDMVVQSTDPTPRSSPGDFRVGDKLCMTIEEPETPFGDMLLVPDKPLNEDRYDKVWEELKQHARTGTPVMGRVLNEVNGGHAIGIAGFVGFAPYSQILRSTANMVGVLQPFYVGRMVDETRNVLVCDARAILRRQEAVRAYAAGYHRPPAPTPSAPASRFFGAPPTIESLARSAEPRTRPGAPGGPQPGGMEGGTRGLREPPGGPASRAETQGSVRGSGAGSEGMLRGWRERAGGAERQDTVRASGVGREGRPRGSRELAGGAVSGAERPGGARASGVGNEAAQERVPDDAGETANLEGGKSAGEEAGEKKAKTEWVTFQGLSDIMQKVLAKKE